MKLLCSSFALEKIGMLLRFMFLTLGHVYLSQPPAKNKQFHA